MEINKCSLIFRVTFIIIIIIIIIIMITTTQKYNIKKEKEFFLW